MTGNEEVQKEIDQEGPEYCEVFNEARKWYIGMFDKQPPCDRFMDLLSPKSSMQRHHSWLYKEVKQRFYPKLKVGCPQCRGEELPVITKFTERLMKDAGQPWENPYFSSEFSMEK